MPLADGQFVRYVRRDAVGGGVFARDFGSGAAATAEMARLRAYTPAWLERAYQYGPLETTTTDLFIRDR